ncbi:MAG: hypothetical protein NZM25_06535 [Leptospiraceae bacterium]|nr:hypothetical protein [Leptospiraceae bacterium]MDW8306568.1 hypothetical protein [Leptospiraceae bacterium]
MALFLKPLLFITQEEKRTLEIATTFGKAQKILRLEREIISLDFGVSDIP